MRASRLFQSSLILLPLCLFGAEYFFSFKSVSKNGLLLNEEFYLSPAMTKSGLLGKKICEIFVEESEFNTTKEALYRYKEEILGCLLKNGVRLRSDMEARGFIDRSTDTLFITPVRLDFRYNNDRLEIFEIKDVND